MIGEGYEINFCFQEDGTISSPRKSGFNFGFQYLVGINKETETILLVISVF